MNQNRRDIRDLDGKSNRLDPSAIAFYLTNTGKLPLLTRGEEIDLSSLIQKMKSLQKYSDLIHTPTQTFTLKKGKQAIDKLQRHNLRLVVSIAKKYQNQGLEFLDLVQEGLIGLKKAIENFDPDDRSMGYKFSTYAYECIREEIENLIGRDRENTKSNLTNNSSEIQNYETKKSNDNINDPLEESTNITETGTSNESQLESCKFGSLAEVDLIYELECLSQLNFQKLNITPLIDENGKFISSINRYELKSPKTLNRKTDYLELIRFLKEDVIKSKFKYTEEVGKLLSICAKYDCKVICSSEIKKKPIGNLLGGTYVPQMNSKNTRNIIINFPENSSAHYFIKSLRHEVIHLIKDEYNFKVLGIDIFDEVTKEVFDSPLYNNNSIESQIHELEAYSADIIPFMTCDIESHFSKFSTIEGSKYAASPIRKKTIELIVKERRIPIYTKKNPSIFLDKKEVEKIFEKEQELNINKKRQETHSEFKQRKRKIESDDLYGYIGVFVCLLYLLYRIYIFFE
ncbi:sigma-70 family RNA polymerase sigma factor [Prochlorococcus marinus]|uniref:sigma-70 family RNA polymerase sigma factor n=1 Tax=Prochlorococcus marinus TaxID=1219 RepID=UPI002FBE8519